MLAAGVVVFRPGRQVLLVHRPKYDDWSFPKGKVDRGEHPAAAAVREVAEETGLHVRLCLPLTTQHYPIAPLRDGRPRTKSVQYWAGRTVGSTDTSVRLPDDEVDQVRWVPVEEAADLLTYPHDRATLDEALARRSRTRAVIVLRHGRARSRRTWRADDRERPLLRAGEEQALRAVPLLAAYDVSRIVSSPSRRCEQTVDPYASATGWGVEPRRRLSEEDVTVRGVEKLIADILDDKRGTVICTHRPVLPTVIAELGVDPGDLGSPLEPGEMLVLHLKGVRIRDIERHAVR